MMQSNLKCNGCGIYLEYNKNSTDVHKYCKRCYNILYHNKNERTEYDEKNIKDILKDLDFKDNLVFMIVDATDIQNSIIDEYLNKKNVIILVNKIDLLSKIINLDRLNSNFYNLLNPICNNKFYLISALSNLNFNKVINEIKKASSKNKKTIFIGKSNSGKTTIIKKICKLNDMKCDLISSSYLNTTQHFSKVKISRTVLVDTPGYINSNSILNYISDSDNNKIFVNKFCSLKVYQIHYPISLRIENLLRIDIMPKTNEKAFIKLLINDNLKIVKSKMKTSDEFNIIKNMITYESNQEIIFYNFDIEKSITNISIPGIGLLSVKNIENIKILITKNVQPYILKHNII